MLLDMTTTTSQNLRALLDEYRARPLPATRKALFALARLPLAPYETRHLRTSDAILLQVFHLDEDGRTHVECSRDGEVLLGLSGSHAQERDALRAFAGLIGATL